MTIDLKCANGHEQVIQIGGALNPEATHVLSTLLDGSSQATAHPPLNHVDSLVGKCALCKAQLHATVRNE